MVNLVTKVPLEEQGEEEEEEEEEEEVTDEFRVRTDAYKNLLVFSSTFTNETLARLITMNFIKYRYASSTTLQLR